MLHQTARKGSTSSSFVQLRAVSCNTFLLEQLPQNTSLQNASPFPFGWYVKASSSGAAAAVATPAAFAFTIAFEVVASEAAAEAAPELVALTHH